MRCSGLPFVGPVGIEGMGNLDPTTYMSPLDLYDSIWWGEYSLFVTW